MAASARSHRWAPRVVGCAPEVIELDGEHTSKEFKFTVRPANSSRSFTLVAPINSSGWPTAP